MLDLARRLDVEPQIASVIKDAHNSDDRTVRQHAGQQAWDILANAHRSASKNVNRRQGIPEMSEINEAAHNFNTAGERYSQFTGVAPGGPGGSADPEIKNDAGSFPDMWPNMKGHEFLRVRR
jgi:hypothetical protein